MIPTLCANLTQSKVLRIGYTRYPGDDPHWILFVNATETSFYVEPTAPTIDLFTQIAAICQIGQTILENPDLRSRCLKDPWVLKEVPTGLLIDILRDDEA